MKTAGSPTIGLKKTNETKIIYLLQLSFGVIEYDTPSILQHNSSTAFC